VTSRNQGLSFASRLSKKDPGNEIALTWASMFSRENTTKMTGFFDFSHFFTREKKIIWQTSELLLSPWRKETL
jgi:hypothetical protein